LTEILVSTQTFLWINEIKKKRVSRTGWV